MRISPSCVSDLGASLARRVQRAALAFVFLTTLLLAAGCERQVGPPLLEPTELAPREVEPGDRLEVHGSAFPQGRAARVTFRGTVFRAGSPALRGVTVDVEGTVTTPDRIEITVDDELADRLCGRGERAAHATFRGDVEVAFASSMPGAPPLVGLLRGATLDVLPSSARASAVEDRIAEGGRVLAFLGVAPGAPSARGLPIEQVGAGSIAERSGILVGDVLAAVDGVNVLSLGDVAPASARSTELVIRRGESGLEETKTVSLLGFSGDRIPPEYASALVILGLALASLLLFVAPGPPSIAVLEARIAAALRRWSVRALASALFGTGRHAALSAILSAVIAALALTPYVVGPEIDGPLMLVAAGAMLVWSRVAAAKGMIASLRTTLQIGAAALVMALAVALAVAQVGAIELLEIVRAQGGAPWQFNAAQKPACAIAFVVYAAAVVAVLRTRSSRRGGAAAPAAPARAALLERAGLLLAAALGVIVFLGGWQLPGIGAPRGRGLLLASAALLVTKTWAVSALLLAASRVAPRRGVSDVPRLALKRLVPALVAAGCVVAASRRVAPSLAIEAALGITVVAVAALLVVRTAARVWTALTRPEPRASPFL